MLAVFVGILIMVISHDVLSLNCGLKYMALYQHPVVSISGRGMEACRRTLMKLESVQVLL